MQSNKSSSDEVRESHGPIILIILIYILPLIIGLSGCFGGNATTESAKQNASTTQTRKINLGLGDRLKKPVEHVGPEPKPEPLDPNWPTTNPDLLAIPEADRWYNAGSKVGTYGTIAGPVGSVYQAKNSPGMPVFVNIGNAYPNGNRAQAVIWGERVPEFEEMLNAIDDGGGAWVSVTGYIGSYEGVPQIDVNDGYTEWTWWT